MEDIRTLEEKLLEQLAESGEEVRMVFVNGYQAKVQILDFSVDALLVKKEGHHWLVYRHAVSTIDMG